MQVTVPIIRLPHGHDLPLPTQATTQAAGVDLMAAIESDCTIAPGDRLVVPTGVAMALPPGFEGQVRPRSGLALKSGLTVLNSPGTIDADYRGEVLVLLINHGREPAVVRRGMRIAQLVVAACCTVRWEDSGDTLEESPRGAGGFGSTGLDAQ